MKKFYYLIILLTIILSITITILIGQSAEDRIDNNFNQMSRQLDDKFFEHEKRNVWQVQQPAMMRILAVYSLRKPVH